jgi:hypothetical protein
MNPVRHLLSDLEDTIRTGSSDRNETTLWQVTDLFLGDVERLTEEQIDIFDTVIARLARAIETRARAELARRLAPVDKAPPGVIRSLALDTIEVARPVLVHSRRLRDEDLVAVATSRSGDHREAIARRPQLSRPVSDVLVARGDEPVMRALASNPGARLSDESVAVLVDRARLDEELRVLLRARRDLPQDQVRRLFEAAEAAARRRLTASTPRDLHAIVEKALTRSTKQVRAAAGSLDYGQALETIGTIEVSRPIDEEDVAGFAAKEDLEETICAVAACAGLSLTAAERLFTVADSDLVLIVAKAQGWRWSTLESLLRLRDPDALLPQQARRLAETFEGLAPETAARVLRFVQRRDRNERPGR